MKKEIDRVYNSKKTPLEGAKDYFFRCLKQPDYQPEHEV